MARSTVNGVIYESEREQFDTCNFHRLSHRVALRDVVVGGRDTRRVVVLEGAVGIGRRYLLHATAYDARVYDPSQNTTVASLDLEGYEPDAGKLETLLATWRAKTTDASKRGRINGLMETLSPSGVPAGLVHVVALASGLELEVSIKSLAKSLRPLCSPASIDGSRRDLRELLKRFLGSVTEQRQLILHVPLDQPGTGLVGEMLLDNLSRLPNVVLAFTVSDAGALNTIGLPTSTKHFCIEPYGPEDMPGVLAKMFPVHRFPADLADALWRSSEGQPGVMAIRINDLKHEGAIFRASDGRWSMPPDGVAAPGCIAALESAFDAPVAGVIEELRSDGQSSLSERLETFLHLAGLCGPFVPLHVLANYMDLVGDDEDVLIDVVDEHFIEGTSCPLFRDVQYHHEGLPGPVYWFASRLLRQALQNRETSGHRASTAIGLYSFLQDHYPVTSRAMAVMHLSVAEHAGDTTTRAALRDVLAWWVSTQDLPALHESLLRRLQTGALEPQRLLRVTQQTERCWSPQLRLVLLDVYGEQLDDIPLGRRVAWLCERGEVLRELGRYQEAADMGERAVDECPEDASSKSLCLSVYGRALLGLGRYVEAAQLCKRALALDENTLGCEHPDVARDVHDIGQILHAQGDFEGALAYIQRALEIDEKAHGPEHPKVAIRVNDIGQILYAKGDLGRAREHAQRALEIDEKMYGPEHPNVAIRANNLGQILYSQGELDAALEHTQRALRIDERICGPEHPKVAIRVNDIGQILYAQGDLDGAREHAQRALAIDEKMYGPGHPNVAIRASNLGQILQAQGKSAEALEHTQRALEIDEAFYGPEHPNVAIRTNNIGQILYAQGDLDGALAYSRRALEIDEKVYGPDDLNVANFANNIGQILYAQGDVDGALAYTRRALRILQNTLGETHPNTRTVRRNLQSLIT